MYKVIWTEENNSLLNEIAAKYNGTFSKTARAFLVSEDEFTAINNEHKIISLSEIENEGDVGNTKIWVDSLYDYLMMMWECMDVSIPSTFTYPEEITISLTDHIDSVEDMYCDTAYEDFEKNAKRLLSSDDWYSMLTKEIKTMCLSLVLDDITNTINSILKHVDDDQ